MSSRQIRKLQQQRELEQAQAKLQAEAEEEESEDEPISSASKPKPSLFANLAALESEGKDEDEDEEEPIEDQHLNDSVLAPKAKKSKKKKKKSLKSRTKDTVIEEDKHEIGGDEIEAALRELNLKAASRPSATNQPTLDPEYERVCQLLGINSYHLKVGNEMKNLFGRTAVESHDDAGGPVGRGARRRQRGQNQQVDLETALKGHHAPGKGLSELTLRRNKLIQGKEDWPKGTTGGLTMTLSGSPAEDGSQIFRFEHAQSYQQLQQLFQNFVEMGDPQNLIGLLVRNPYHISLLIQVSKIAKDQGDHALSSDLLERALFTFGRAATSTFNNKLSQGKARLEFPRPENRELWLAGYQYFKSLMMKGTYRTALEWTKLLLTLQPMQDPYCTRLTIHHLALRAHEFKWLMDLYDSAWGEVWKKAAENHNPAINHVLPSLALAALSLRDGVKCRELLSESMSKVPWLFFRLFKELNLDAPPSIWGVEPRTDAETLFTELYVLQTKDLWNTPEATALLMEIAHTIPKINNLSTIPTVDDSEMTLDVVRFIYLDNTPALMAMAPSKLLHRSNNSDADPLPPDHNVFSYSSQRDLLEQTRSMGGDYNDPLHAIGRLVQGMPGFRDLMGGSRNAEDVHELEDELQSMFPDDGGPPPGFLQRLIASMFDRGDEFDEDSEEGVATDDEMPGLEPLETDREDEDEFFSDEMAPDTDGLGGSGMESDDEIPPLVPIN